jgi:hypothetical protein
LYKTVPKILTEDIISCFAKGLYCLFREEKKEKRSISGWSVGYLLGFVASSLSVHWYYHYVYCQTDEYKQLMFFKAMILYLGVDSLIVNRIERLHKYLLDNKVDVSEKMGGKLDNIIVLEDYKMKNNPQEFQTQLISYLEKIMLEKHEVIFNNIIKKSDDLELEYFFTEEEIESLISLAAQF